MKDQRFAVALATFMMGAGGGLASSLYLSDVYVKGRVQPGGQILCINTLKQCQSSGTTICMVRVPTLVSGPYVTATSSGPVRTYAADCEFILTNISDFAATSSVQAYELISDYRLD